MREHLQAVTEGEIKRLLINIPFRSGKSLVTSVCWPAWVWSRGETSHTSGANVGFLCASYGHSLSLQHSNLTRRLILSPWYQERWSHRFKLRMDQNTKTQFDNDKKGYRISTSVGGVLLGIGAAILCADDPENTEQVESEAELAAALTWWREFSTTRLNDQEKTAIVVNMQRLSQADISGEILDKDMNGEWCHFCVPMRYDWQRHCITVLGWQDPRGLDDDGEPLVVIGQDGARIARDAEALRILNNECEGSLMWPERFPEHRLKAIEAEMGPHMAAGRLQQSPMAKGGSIFKREWWQLWDPPRGPNGQQMFPAMDYVIGSVDSAYTTAEENDPTGFVAFGVFTNPQDGQRRIILVGAWRKHLAFSADRSLIEWRPYESSAQNGYALWCQRTQQYWGLLEWLQYSCRRYKIDKLLIESKASGISAATEMRNRFGRENWSVQLCTPKGDKLARAYAAQPTFAQQLVYAPNKDWAEEVITEMSLFPHGRRDDLTDAVTQAISYLRSTGLAKSDEEIKAEETERVTHDARRYKRRPLYPV
jgi:predicted phage terminase large subunit-like protein